MKEAIASLLKWVKSRQTDSKLVVLVAHNGHCFDFPFLVRTIEQNDNQVPNDWLLFDTLPFARQLRHPDGRPLSLSHTHAVVFWKLNNRNCMSLLKENSEEIIIRFE